MLFGRDPISKAVCKQYPRTHRTALDPNIIDCNFKHTCQVDRTVDIRVRHCGSFYVYFLQPGVNFNTELEGYYRIPRLDKKGLYCGTKDQTLPKPIGKS